MHDDPNDEFAILSRRTMLTGSLVVGGMLGGMTSGLLGSTPALAGETAKAGLLPREGSIPADAAARAAIVRRVRLRTDSGPVFWYFRGRNYAQQGAKLIPLCELNFGAIGMVTQNPDGSMDVMQYELGFRTAIGTSTRTDQLQNPVTGEMIDVPFVPVGPTHIHYGADNHRQLQPEIGGSKFTVNHKPEDFYHVGDLVCFQTHAEALVETPGRASRRLNDMSMICSPAREALDPQVHFASAFAQGGDVSDYPRWWKMPPGSGTQTLRSIGQKVERLDQMPADWLEMLAKVDPIMATDPMAGLKRETAVYRN